MFDSRNVSARYIRLDEPAAKSIWHWRRNASVDGAGPLSARAVAALVRTEALGSLRHCHRHGALQRRCDGSGALREKSKLFPNLQMRLKGGRGRSGGRRQPSVDRREQLFVGPAPPPRRRSWRAPPRPADTAASRSASAGPPAGSAASPALARPAPRWRAGTAGERPGTAPAPSGCTGPGLSRAATELTRSQRVRP